MRSRKVVYANYPLFDRTGVQIFLKKQADKGWRMTDVKGAFWFFSRKNSHNLSYAIAFFPKSAEESQEPTEEQLDFIDFCARDGWELTALRGPMHIFSSTAEDPMPLETDPEVEVETIHKAVRKMYHTHILLAVLWVFLALLRLPLFKLRRDPDSYEDIFILILYLCIGAMQLFDVIHYYSWRRKAKQALAMGKTFTPTHSNPWLQLLMMPLIMFFFSKIFAVYTQVSIWYVMGLFTVLTVCIFGISILTQSPADEENSPKAKLRSYASMFALILCIGGVAFCFLAPLLLKLLG